MKTFTQNQKAWARLGVFAVIFVSLVSARSQSFIVSTVPTTGASGVSPSASVVFTFNEPMDTALTTAEFRDGTTFAILPTASAWSNGDKVLTCTPTPAFPSSRFIIWTANGESLTAEPLEGETGGFFSTSSGGGGTGSGTNRITAFSVGKIHFYNQTSAGAPTLDVDVPYIFAATTTLASNRSANSVTITLPTSAVSNLTQNFVAPESFYLFSTWSNLAPFNANYPAGTYTFNVVAAASNQLVTVNLPNLAQPNAPHLTSFPAVQSVNAAQPFVLSWDAFQGGTAADFITVSVGDVFQSPDAGRPGALNGTATSIQIPAGTLQANSNYAATIGFYRATSSSNASYTTLAYLATSADFTLITSGGGGGTSPLVFTNSSWAGGAFSFSVVSAAGQSFAIDYSTTMQTNQWQTLLTTNSATGLLRITHAATNQYRFYRARKVP